jgi:hypothetical protein
MSGFAAVVTLNSGRTVEIEMTPDMQELLDNLEEVDIRNDAE